jgi:hypothetical protein
MNPTINTRSIASVIITVTVSLLRAAEVRTTQTVNLPASISM